MVALTFPDGARRDYPDGSTGLDIAKAISPSLKTLMVTGSTLNTTPILFPTMDHKQPLQSGTTETVESLPAINRAESYHATAALQSSR